jgi:hypothetical protein
METGNIFRPGDYSVVVQADAEEWLSGKRTARKVFSLREKTVKFCCKTETSSGLRPPGGEAGEIQVKGLLISCKKIYWIERLQNPNVDIMTLEEIKRWAEKGLNRDLTVTERSLRDDFKNRIYLSQSGRRSGHGN